MKHTEVTAIDITKIAIRHISDLEKKIRQRCLLEGCRYSMMEGEPLQDKCIYCGSERYEPWGNYEYPVSLNKMLNRISKKDNK